MADTPNDDPSDDAQPEFETSENEVLRAARSASELKRASEAKAAEKADAESGGIGWKTAAGIGIGSAALVAALLYARKSGK